ncbi:acyl-CoA thioesterase-1 [Salinimicrobium catena]|uniref:Acyl-CoA thioesterase-1 n=1 Tax=Salinimicrobium catena TaxID=390640 RepID=A0A1H5NGY6_9FLAO|nr:arylesterase [Salinimicrobium catena]SDL44578.1 acyl-CoA thioesterase-1 [Salinimicrobium catena]SEF00097.1 acyl-CoA thioesterase-1 [Salinimicrobium catena]
MRNLNPKLLLIIMTLFLSCGEQKQEQEKPAEEKETREEKKTAKNILFFGDSLTAGMGLDPNEAFPAVIQEKLDSLGLNYNVINAGLSGETTASGKNRIDWVLNQEVDIFVLELGANDGLRGIPPRETRKNLQEIIKIVRKKNPDTRIILAGMQIPPNMGPEYTAEFRKIFPELAKKNNVELIPFLLEDVAGNPELNQADGIHPTEEGHQIVAENVWEVLKPMLKN